MKTTLNALATYESPRTEVLILESDGALLQASNRKFDDGEDIPF